MVCIPDPDPDRPIQIDISHIESSNSFRRLLAQADVGLCNEDVDETARLIERIYAAVDARDAQNWGGKSFDEDGLD